MVGKQSKIVAKFSIGGENKSYNNKDFKGFVIMLLFNDCDK